MIKPAKTKFDIHPLIKKRFSPRGYSDEQVLKEELNRMLEAASWASSSFNEQPWRFILGIKNEGEGYDKIFQCLTDKNKTWAITAQVLLLTLSKKTLIGNGAQNRFHSYDTGQAMAMMSIQAVNDNIFITQMGGFNSDLARELFKISDDYEILACVAVGKINYEAQAKQTFREENLIYRTRNDLSEFVFVNDFGNSYK